MPRQTSATGNVPSDPLAMFKATLATAYFIVTLLSGMLTRKLLWGKGKIMISTATQVAAGVILGTAMMDLISRSDVIFHVMGFNYPMAFLIFSAGYVVAMLVDCLLARAVSRLSLEHFDQKFLDGFMLDIADNMMPTKDYDISETKKSSGIGCFRRGILDEVILFVDCVFVLYPFSVLSAVRGAHIGGADTKNLAWRAFLNAASHNTIYTVSLAIMVMSFYQCIPLIGNVFVIGFSLFVPAGVIIDWISLNYDIKPGTGPSEPSSFGDKVGPWIEGIVPGFLAGILVHLSLHHLLVDGSNKTRYGRFVAIITGVGAVALLKVLEI